MKAKKFLAVLLAMLMAVSLLPASAFAADTPAADEITIGDPEAVYTLRVENNGESAQKVNYTVTVNGASQTVALAGGEYAEFGINEGDSYSVTAGGTASPYYKVTSSTGSFVCGEKENSSIGDSWSHVLGQGFKVGEKAVYKADGAEIDAADVTAVDDSTWYQTSTATTWTANDTYWTTSKTIGFGRWGYTLTISHYGVSLTGSNGKTYKSGDSSVYLSQSTAEGCINSCISSAKNDYYGGSAVQTGSVDYSTNTIGQVTDISGTITLAKPVTRTIEDIIDPCPANDVTVAFVPVVAERTGEASVTVYNEETLKAADAAFTYDNIQYIADNFSSISSIAGGTYDLDTITELAQSDTANALAKVLLVNELGDSTVTLTEVDDGNGYYEGREYVLTEGADQQLPVKATVSVPIFGDTTVFDTTIPVNVGKLYDFSNVRIGHYTMTVQIPSGDGYVCDNTVFDVQVTEGGKVTVGEYKEYLSISGSVDVFGYSIPLSATLFRNTGVYVDRVENYVSFTKVDMGCTALAGADFVLVNRDQALAILDVVVSAGRETVNSAIQNGVGGLDYDQLVEFLSNIGSSAEYAETDSATANEFLESYTSLLVNGLTDKPAPAILKAVSDENGAVNFTEADNVTVPVLVDLLIQAKETLGEFNTDFGGNQVAGFTLDELAAALNEVKGTDTAYLLLKTVGIVGDKFPTGTYVLFESAAPEGYYRNPAMYTFSNTWNGAAYDTYAQIGVVLPLVAPELYDYFEQIADYNEQIGSVAHDMAAMMDEAVDIAFEQVDDDTRAAVIAYAADLVYYRMGGDAVYDSPEAAADALVSALEGEYNLEAVVNAINALATQAKTVISGDVNADWYYYNISEDVFSNAYDLFDYVLRKLVPAEAADAIEEAAADETAALEEAVNGTAETVTEAVEDARDTAESMTDELITEGTQVIEAVTEAAGTESGTAAEG